MVNTLIGLGFIVFSIVYYGFLLLLNDYDEGTVIDGEFYLINEGLCNNIMVMFTILTLIALFVIENNLGIKLGDISIPVAIIIFCGIAAKLGVGKTTLAVESLTIFYEGLFLILPNSIAEVTVNTTVGGYIMLGLYFVLIFITHYVSENI